MQRYWDTITELDRDGFHVVLDKSWEDCSPADLFDDSCHDIADICAKIDNGTYDWFMLRARVYVDGIELGEHCCGGFLYEDAREVLNDGMADDIIGQAIWEGLKAAKNLSGKLMLLTLKNSDQIG